MEAYYAEFPAQSKPSDEHAHAGAEVIYVLSGQLAVSIEGKETILAEGDAMHFDSGLSHSYRQQGRAACSAIVVVAPLGN
jgi:quercetin dioxygenase-like cupin family protein